MSVDVPWEERSLGSLLASMESGSRPKGGVRGIADGIPSLGGEHLNAHGGFNVDNVRFVPQAFYDSMRRGHIRRGDVLVVKDGATTGKVSFVGKDFPYERAVANEHLFVCRPESVDGEYLFWYLYSDEGQRRIREHFKGSAQGGITRDFAEGTLVPLARTRDQQERLADLLGTAFTHRLSADDHVATARHAIERFRQAVLAAACSGRLTADWRETAGLEPAEQGLHRRRECERARLGKKYREPFMPDAACLPDIPEGWTWAALPELGELGRGRSSHRPRNDPKLYGGQYPFIQTGDVARSRGLITTHSQTYNEGGLAQSRLWPARTVCITIAANIADSGLLTYPACFPDSVVGLIADEQLALPEYVELFVQTARRDLAAFAPATAQANINLAILAEVAVALPPVEEQGEIVSRVEHLYRAADTLLDRIDGAAKRVDRSSQAVLAKAFRGELVPSSKEPAR